MTVALSLLTAFAWTALNFWLVPLSRTVDPYVASLVMLVGNGLCTIPLALALDGVPTHDDLGPLGYAVLAGVLEAGGFVLFFRALEAGRSRGRRTDHRHRGRHRGARGARVRRADRLADRSRARDRAGRRLPGGCAGAAQHRRGRAAGVRRRALLRLHVRALRRGRGSRPGLRRRRRPAERPRASCARSCCGAGRRSRAARCLSRLLVLGALDAGAFVSYAYAAARGPVSVAAVVAGQFSTLSAIAGIVLLRERLTPHQYIGHRPGGRRHDPARVRAVGVSRRDPSAGPARRA